MIRPKMMQATLAALLASTAAAATAAFDRDARPDADELRWRGGDPAFNRIATFANYRNRPDLTEETVSEIVAVSADGRTAIYTDGEQGAIGFVDISDPRDPAPAGTLALDGPVVGGDSSLCAGAAACEPTSVAVHRGYALVGVNTSESFVSPSGHLAVVDIAARQIVAELPLGGQPDSVAVSPDGAFAAVAIENERDEEICVGGANDGQFVDEDDDAAIDACEAGGGVVGGLPQTPFGNPPGFLAVVDLAGMNPAAWSVRPVALTGLADFAPEDPEPEFVDINAHNEAVVSLQENNHIAIVDLAAGVVTGDFPLGAVTLNGIDATEDGVISLTETLTDLPREPDAVAWVPVGRGQDRGRGRGAFVVGTANEGDLFGGSRGFSLFNPNGALLFDSAAGFEELAVQHGHYPEERSENKGSEPEAIEWARFGRDSYLFVASERGSFVAVYRLRGTQPRFVQLLPAPLGPEGVLAVPSRNLLLVSGEEDDPRFGVRSTIMIYELQDEAPDYPQILSADDPTGKPIGWSALSGMVAVPGSDDQVLAVWDAFYSESRVFRVDVDDEPAVVREALTLRGGSGDFDPEGIDVAPDGSLWIASEGNDPGTRPNRLLQADPVGNIVAEFGLPAEIEACRLASTDTANLDNGFEGVAVQPTDGGYRLLAAQQLPWNYTTPECEALDDEPGFTRIWILDPATGDWTHVAYQLAPVPAQASWVGLSEITRTLEGDFLVIERDNRTGDFAEVKTLVQFSWQATDDGVISADEKQVLDLLGPLRASSGWITDKPEGTAVMDDGRVLLVTDNDGVDDWSGETWFLDLGELEDLFGEGEADDDDRDDEKPGRGRGRGHRD